MTSDSNVKASNARTPSTTSKKDGFREDPGARMLERKSFSDGDVCWDVSLSESRSVGSSIADTVQKPQTSPDQTRARHGTRHTATCNTRKTGFGTYFGRSLSTHIVMIIRLLDLNEIISSKECVD